ncbi:MAG: hypothetical protein UIB61_04260 [Treponema sp.]|nr:hypothetical protein [Treponema sp.]
MIRQYFSFFGDSLPCGRSNYPANFSNGQIDCSPDYMYENSFEYNTKDVVVA